MTQSGTGGFNITTGTGGNLQQIFINATIFSKAFNNMPVIMINITGVGPVANHQSRVGISDMLHFVNSYQIVPQKITETGFNATLELGMVWFSTPINGIGLAFSYNWIAYDEVTIGA